jgi:hypothetical protein
VSEAEKQDIKGKEQNKHRQKINIIVYWTSLVAVKKRMLLGDFWWR